MSYSPNLFKINTSGDAELTVANLVANALKPGSGTLEYTASGDDATGNFENTGANLSHDGTSWGNDLVAVTGNLEDTATLISQDNGGSSATWALLTDNITSWQGFTIDGATCVYVLDFGAGTEQIINYMKLWFYYGNAQVKLEWTDDDPAGTPSWTDLGTVYNPWSNPNAHQQELTWTHSTPKRGYRITISIAPGAPAGQCRPQDFTLGDYALASTSNTTDGQIPFTGTLSFAPASLVIKNASDVSLTTGQVNVAYSFDNVSYSSLVDIDTFKALSKATFASKSTMWLRVQPVGSSTIKTVAISTEGAEARANADGFTYFVDSVEVAKIGAADLSTSYQMYSKSVALTSATNAVAVDASGSNVFTHTLTEHTTVSAPTNLKSGAVYTFVVVQDASSAYTCAWNAVFKGSPSAVSATLSSVNVYQFVCYDGTNLVKISETTGA